MIIYYHTHRIILLFNTGIDFDTLINTDSKIEKHPIVNGTDEEQWIGNPPAYPTDNIEVHLNSLKYWWILVCWCDQIS